MIETPEEREVFSSMEQSSVRKEIIRTTAQPKQEQGEPLIWSTTQGGAYACGEYLVSQRVDGKGWNALGEHKQLLLGASLEDCKSICERDAVTKDEMIEMIEMARQAGWQYAHGDSGFEPLWAFAKLVAEKERENCALIADEWAVGWPHPSKVIAGRIRARGDKA